MRLKTMSGVVSIFLLIGDEATGFRSPRTPRWNRPTTLRTGVTSKTDQVTLENKALTTVENPSTDPSSTTTDGTPPNDYAYLAVFVKEKNHKLEGVCAGSIISPNHILTGGYCAYSWPYPLLQVRAGKQDGPEESQDLIIIRKVNSRGFRSMIGGYDITIVTTASGIRFTKLISLIDLPRKSMELVGEKLQLTGWTHDCQVQNSDVLIKEPVKVAPMSSCTSVLRFGGTASDNLCTLPLGQNFSKTKEGSPLIWTDPKTNVPVLVGIVANAHRISNLEGPTASIAVASFLSWIDQEMP